MPETCSRRKYWKNICQASGVFALLVSKDHLLAVCGRNTDSARRIHITYKTNINILFILIYGFPDKEVCIFNIFGPVGDLTFSSLCRKTPSKGLFLDMQRILLSKSISRSSL